MIQTLQEQVDEATLWAHGDHPRIPLGFPFIDSRIGGGVAYSEMSLFLARSGVGKTFWLTNVLANNPQVPAILFSLEMAARAMVVRVASVASNTPTAEIHSTLELGRRSPILDGMTTLLPKLAIVDEPGLSLRQMTDRIYEFEDMFQERPRLIGIDYLELVGGTPGMERAAQVSDVARSIKDWARAHDVHVIVLHQVARGDKNNGHVPLSLFSGKYGGEEAADYVFAAYRPALEPGITQKEKLSKLPDFRLQFLKTRGGFETHEAGVRHVINPRSGAIRPALPESSTKTPLAMLEVDHG